MQATVAGRTCEVCGAARVNVLRHSRRWGFDVGRCANCKMVFVLTQTTGDALGVHEFDEVDWDGYVSVMRDDARARLACLDKIRSLLGVTDRRPLLYDVGAGSGEFLVQARDHGFDVAGNELSASAVDYAREHHGIELSAKMLDESEPESVDAITMWCVLAHVPDPATFLRETYAMLRPGGVLFMRTPRWCLIDTVGTAVAKGSRNRFDQVADRRVFPGHWHHYNTANMLMQLKSVGFCDNEAVPTCHYTMHTDAYLTGTGGPITVLKRFSGVLDTMLSHDWLPRNTLMVYARRPYDS